MVRPPAIYGPGDMEMRDLFRLARWGIALLPPPGKLSVIEVSDLARLLLALVDGRSNRRLLEADDGKPGGWTHDEFANAIGRAVGQRVRSEEHTSELQSLMRISYAVFCLKQKKKTTSQYKQCL